MFWIQSFYPANMDFISRRSCFPESYYSGFKVIIPDPKLLFRIQSYFSGSKVFTLDPKLLFRIQNYYSGSKVITPDPKFYSGSKVFTADPKFLLWIQSYYSGNKLRCIQFNILILDTYGGPSYCDVRDILSKVKRSALK